MKWLALAFALLFSSAQAQVGLPFPGPGGVHASAGPTFAFAGTDTTNVGSTTWTSTAVTINSSESDRFVMLAYIDQNHLGLTTVTVNGISLAQDVTANTGTGPGVSFWSGLVGTAGGNGAATIIMNCTSCDFTSRAVAIWIGTGMNSTAGAKNTGSSAVGTPTINISAGDFLLAQQSAGSTVTITGTAPDATPTANRSSTVIGSVQLEAAEWNTISSSNASFGITAVGSLNTAAASYR